MAHRPAGHVVGLIVIVPAAILAAGLGPASQACAQAVGDGSREQVGVFVAGPLQTRGGSAGVSGGEMSPANQGESGESVFLEPVLLGEDVTGVTRMVLTPATAARLAAQNSLDLQLTAASIQEAEAQVKAALGLDDFTVRGSASYTRSGPARGDADVLTQTVSVNRPLYDAQRTRLRQVAAQQSLAIMKLREQVTALSLDFTARRLTFEVLRAKGLLDVAVQQANALSEHLSLSERLFAGGEVARFEVVQAQTELAKAQGEIVSARANLERTASQLRRGLTLDETVPLQIEPGEEAAPPTGNRSELIRLAFKHRPEIIQAQCEVELAETNLRLARKTSAVSVDLNGGLSRSDSDNGDWRWQIGVSASKPFADGRARESEVEAARARLASAHTALRQVQEDVRAEVVEAEIDLLEARERLAVARQGVVEARERLAIAKVRYETKYSTGIEVVDAESSLTRAQTELINAGFDVQVAIARLRMAVGLLGD